MLSSVDRTWRKTVVCKAVDNDYTNWQAVGDLDFANDRTAYMMEIFESGVGSTLSFSTVTDWIAVWNYDNIYPNMYQNQGFL